MAGPDSSHTESFKLLAELGESLLADELSHKQSLESRSISVIATSGTLATFLFGLSTFARNTGHGLSRADDDTILSALLLFFVAAASAVCAIYLRHFQEFSSDDLAAYTDAAADGQDITARLPEHRAQLAKKSLPKARTVNHWKARFLQAALTSEVAAVALLVASVTLVIYGD